MRTILSAVLVASTLAFSLGAHADDRGHRSWSSERHHYDRDNDRRYEGRYEGRYQGRYDRGRDSRWNNRGWSDRGGYRDYRSGYRPYYAPPRYYWRQSSRWYYGPVPRGYRGSYYSYPPRDSYGQLIISIPLF